MGTREKSSLPTMLQELVSEDRLPGQQWRFLPHLSSLSLKGGESWKGDHLLEYQLNKAAAFFRIESKPVGSGTNPISAVWRWIRMFCTAEPLMMLSSRLFHTGTSATICANGKSNMVPKKKKGNP